MEELDQRLAFLEEESAVRQEKITQLIALATQLEEKAHNLGALMETHKEALDQLGIDTNDLIARVKALEEEAAATKETAATKQELAQTSERQENLEQELNRLGDAWLRWKRISPVNWHDRSRMCRPPWKAPLLS